MKTPKQAAQTPTSTTAAVDISQLTPSQIKALRATLRESAKKIVGDATKRNVVIDKMLHSIGEDKQFTFTTADILAQLQQDGIIAKELSNDDRAAAFKMIQTRKQHLVKKGDTAVGYKVSPTGISVLDVHRVIAWLNNASEADVELVREACDDI
jgi:hypothetical protein